jgi:CRISPR/Cas system-associated endonuclease Cas1
MAALKSACAGRGRRLARRASSRVEAPALARRHHRKRIDKKSGKESLETRFFIASLEPDPKAIRDAVRSHWGVENNNLHWTLDAVFDEDRCKTRKKTPFRPADHPVNALLNWSYAIVAGRLAVELFARGACLAICYLHVEQPNRYSLVYDALDLLRPIVDEKVFEFVAKTLR